MLQLRWSKRAKFFFDVSRNVLATIDSVGDSERGNLFVCVCVRMISDTGENRDDLDSKYDVGVVVFSHYMKAFGRANKTTSTSFIFFDSLSRHFLFEVRDDKRQKLITRWLSTTPNTCAPDKRQSQGRASSIKIVFQ